MSNERQQKERNGWLDSRIKTVWSMKPRQHRTGSTWEHYLINTPIHGGVQADGRTCNRFNGFPIRRIGSRRRETVETVTFPCGRLNTPMNGGVNEIARKVIMRLPQSAARAIAEVD